MSDVIIPIESTEQVDQPYVGKPHNGPITKIEVSPNGKYLVTYDRKDKDRSIVGWNVEGINEGRLEPDFHNIKTVKLVEKNGGHKIANRICVSDDSKLAY